MGLWRTSRKVINSFKDYKRDQLLRQLQVFDYEGLAVPTRRTGMITPIQLQIYHGEYERPEINGLSKVIRLGDRVLELGAGLGIITALAARIAGPKGRVLAYEANAALLDDTLAFFAANRITTVDLVNAVLVPESNPAPRQFHLAGSFAESSLLGADGRNPQGKVEVPAESLADVLASFRPDVLICDIEGAEAELLASLPPSTLRAAVVEMHPDRISSAQIQSIHDALAAQDLCRQEPGPGGTVVIYAKTGTA
jgi:FkbM family methyltransferase